MQGYSALHTEGDVVRYLRLDAARQGLALHHRSNQSVPVHPSDSDTAGCQAVPSHQLPANRAMLSHNDLKLIQMCIVASNTTCKYVMRSP